MSSDAALPEDDAQQTAAASALEVPGPRWPTGSYLSLLSDRARELLLSAGRSTWYDRDEVIIREGEQSTFLVLILAGLTKVTSMTPEGHVSLLAFRTGGDLVGEQGALDHGPRSATVTAVTPVRAIVISSTAFLRLVQKEPFLALALVSAVSAKLRAATRARVDTGGYPVATRLARTLTQLATSYGRATEAGTVIDFPLSQDDLAALVSSSAAAVARALRQLREQGVVETRYRELTITDWDELSKLAAEE